MKITVLCGEDVDKVFARKSQIIKAIGARGWEIQTLIKDDKSLAEKLRSTSLFEEQKLFVIDNITILSAADLVWLKKNPNLEINLLVATEGSLPVKIKNSLGKDAKIEKFDLPQKLFVFLESLVPNNSSRALGLLHEIVENEPVEKIFATLATHFRDLYWIKLDPKSFKGHPFRIKKLTTQSVKFTPEQLKDIINQMAEFDIKAKTSNTDLSQSLDLLLISSLQ